jgi:hypothetical protein
MTHVDQNVDWFAHARARKLAFEQRTKQAAQALAERNAPPPAPPPLPPPPPFPVPPSPVPPTSPIFSKLVDYRPQWRIIAQEVCAKHKITLKELQGDRRFKKYSNARREVYWRMRTELRMSLLDIAQKMGKDHTTVLHGLRVYARDHQPAGEKHAAS